MNGLGFMWNPDFQALAKPQTWLAAAGQIFFTLGVGFGIIINYSSYLKRKDDVVLSSLTASSVNEFFEVCLGGMITIPAAFLFLGALNKYGTYDVGFKTLPNVFAAMFAGRLFGFLWFVMLFLAAITSSLSMLQPVIAFFEEGLGLKRHASVAFLGLVTAIGSGLVVWFSKDRLALDTLDFWGGTMLLFVLATIQAVLYGWVLGIERGEKSAHEGAHLRIPRFVQFVIKYISPAFLLIVFAGTIYTDGPEYWKTLTTQPVAGMSFGFIGLVFVFLLILIHIAGQRWKAAGRLADESPDKDGG
jgi:SNF family Na+-dependent transporter